MKSIISVLSFLLLCLQATSQEHNMSADEWDKEAVVNIRLLPKYGTVEKTEQQKIADSNFISTILNDSTYNGDKLKASNHFIGLGFTYLNRGDVKTAMYRFNQAYLLENNNPEIYWGYGAVYMSLLKFDEAKTQYQSGLAIDPQNTHLLTDFGTYYQTMFHIYSSINIKKAQKFLDTAISTLNKSYTIDAKDPNTSYKLAVAYFSKSDCKMAIDFLKKCDALGGAPVENDFRVALNELCNTNSRKQ